LEILKVEKSDSDEELMKLPSLQEELEEEQQKLRRLKLMKR